MEEKDKIGLEVGKRCLFRCNHYPRTEVTEFHILENSEQAVKVYNPIGNYTQWILKERLGTDYIFLEYLGNLPLENTVTSGYCQGKTYACSPISSTTNFPRSCLSGNPFATGYTLKLI
jgi:hypothetical protein